MDINPKNIISLTEARRRIFDIAEDVQQPENHYIFTDNGRAKAVMMSAEEFDSMMENIEILSDPKAMKAIEEAEKAYQGGDYVLWDDFKKKLEVSAEELVVADKKGKYEAPKRKKKKSK